MSDASQLFFIVSQELDRWENFDLRKALSVSKYHITMLSDLPLVFLVDVA